MKKFIWPESPVQKAFPVAKDGYCIIFAAVFTTLVFALLNLVFPALLFLALTFFICFFFRDPDRLVPTADNAIVSPADGKVVSAENLAVNRFFEEPCLKISVFMSLFNVHVNRIPYEGIVRNINYFPGKFFSANLDKASKENEHNAVFLETEEGKKICFVQIAGLIARRIICKVQEDEAVTRGQRFGMICFGSRLDLYLPADTKLNVSVGDRVTAGSSIVGYLS